MKLQEKARGVEYSGLTTDHFNGGWLSLAKSTGIPIERIAQLGVHNELHALFGTDGRLRAREDFFRSMDRATGTFGHPYPVELRTPQQKVLELHRKRWTREPLSPQQVRARTMARRYAGGAL